MQIVSVTRLHLRSVRFLPAFFWYSNKSARQAKKTAGNLGVNLRKTNGLAFWTMQKLPYWCDEAAFADWEQDSSQRPSWEEAAQRLGASGRLARVLYPSARQKAGKVVATD